MLTTEINGKGVTVVTRTATGEEVAYITPHETYGFWVNLIEGYSFNAMPMMSLEAAGYLILASVLEHDAKVPA